MPTTTHILLGLLIVAVGVLMLLETRMVEIRSERPNLVGNWDLQLELSNRSMPTSGLPGLGQLSSTELARVTKLVASLAGLRKPSSFVQVDDSASRWWAYLNTRTLPSMGSKDSASTPGVCADTPSWNNRHGMSCHAYSDFKYCSGASERGE